QSMQKILSLTVAASILSLAATPALAGIAAPVPSIGPAGLLVLASGIGAVAWLAIKKRS
ncbi:MAG: hypothetical protein JRJ58_12320, partial [Deltaproteobacteria bacterium]|nr:hypothetical protein [Deltaproteobacteria bacterium]